MDDDDKGNFIADILSSLGSRGKPKVTGYTDTLRTAPGQRLAGSGLFKGLGGIAKNTSRIGVPLAGALMVLDAAGEFTDANDPILRNASEAVGGLGGGLAGLTTGAALGAGVGSLVPVVGTGIGALVGGGLGYMGLAGPGKAIGGGIYDFLANETPATRREKAAQVDANIAANTRRTMLPVTEEELMIKYLDDERRLELQRDINNDYNLANAANQAQLNAQRAAEIQQLALLSGL